MFNRKAQRQLQAKKKTSGGMKFLISVIVLYLIIAVFNYSFVQNSFLNFLKIYFKIIPILGMVFIFMVFVNLYFTEKRINKYLGKEAGIKGWFYSIIAGILVSGPPYILFPLLKDLKKKGMKISLVAVFLYNRNVKIPFLPVMVYYFGWEYTLILSVYIMVFSILSGVLFEVLDFNVERTPRL
jgi:uncharacterized membrane protein YraQ (UPF0718 family)